MDSFLREIAQFLVLKQQDQQYLAKLQHDHQQAERDVQGLPTQTQVALANKATYDAALSAIRKKDQQFQILPGRKESLSQNPRRLFFVLLKHFLDKLDPKTELADMNLAVKALSQLAKCIKLYMGEMDLQKVMQKLLLNSERLFVNTTMDRIHAHTSGMPDFVTCFARILSEHSAVETSTLDALVNIVGRLFLIYPSMLQSHQYRLFASLRTLMLVLHSKGAIFSQFLDKVVPQALLLSIAETSDPLDLASAEAFQSNSFNINESESTVGPDEDDAVDQDVLQENITRLSDARKLGNKIQNFEEFALLWKQLIGCTFQTSEEENKTLSKRAIKNKLSAIGSSAEKQSQTSTNAGSSSQTVGQSRSQSLANEAGLQKAVQSWYEELNLPFSMVIEMEQMLCDKLMSSMLDILNKLNLTLHDIRANVDIDVDVDAVNQMEQETRQQENQSNIVHTIGSTADILVS
jgi:hypothetical protein